MDYDIKSTLKSLSVAEKQRNHKWNWELKCTKDEPCNPAERVKYNFKPELADDIKVSQANLANAEEKLGTKYGTDI